MSKKNSFINLEVHNVVGHTLNSDQEKFSVKLDFRGKLIGESPKVDVTDGNKRIFNYSFSINAENDDPNFWDDLVNRPIIKHYPKDKKQKDLKPQIAYNATFDLISIINEDIDEQELTLKMYPPSGSPYEKLDFENNPIIIKLCASISRFIKEQFNLLKSNVVRFSIESLFSPPETLINCTNTSQVSVCFPFSNEIGKEVVASFVPGILKYPVDKENNLKKWNSDTAYLLSGAVNIPNSYIPYYKNLSCEEGDYKSEEFLEHRMTALNTKPRILWNQERRFFLSSISSEFTKSKLAKNPIIPIEIYKLNLPSSSKNKKEEEPLYNFHGVAYVDCTTLLYPGVRKLRGAYQVYPFMQHEYQVKSSRRINILDESIHQVASSLNTGCTIAGGLDSNARQNLASDMTSVISNKKPSLASSLGEKLKADKRSVSRAGNTIEEERDGLELPAAGNSISPSNNANSESQQYLTNKSFIMIEISFDKSLVSRREPEEFKNAISSYIREAKPVLPKKTSSAQKAVENYQKQLVEIAEGVIEDFCEMFKEKIQNGNLPNSVAEFEELKKDFYYMLNSSGKYFAFKERLKYSVVRIVREKFYHTKPLKNDGELQLFLQDLYVYLTKELHIGLKTIFSPKEPTERTITVAQRKFTPDALYRFAIEAEQYGKKDWAAKYYQERIAKYQTEASHWFDYGVFFLGEGKVAEAHECFRETLKLNGNYVEGLIATGLCCLIEKDFEKTSTLLECALVIRQNDPVLWIIMGMYYNQIDDQILSSMAFTEAHKLEETQILLARDILKTEKSTIIDEAPQNHLNLEVPNLTEHQDTSAAQEEHTAEKSRRFSTAGSKNRGSKTPNQVMDVGSHVFEFEYNDETEVLKNYEDLYLRTANLLISMHFEQFAVKVLSLERVRLETLRKLVNTKNKSSSLDLSFDCGWFEENEEDKDKKIQDLANDDANLLIKNENIPLLNSFVYFNEQSSKFQMYLGLCALSQYKNGQDSLERALSHCKYAVKLNPESSDAWTILGHIQAKNVIYPDHKSMKSYYEHALNLRSWPTTYQPHVVLTRLGSEYLEECQFEKAKQTFLYACELAPTCISWLGTGKACYRLNELVDAEQALNEANSLNNREPDVWAYLSLVFLKTGRIMEAEQCFKYACKMGLGDDSSLMQECIELQNIHGLTSEEKSC